MYTKSVLSDMLVSELREVASGMNLSNYNSLAKEQLVEKILMQQALVEALKATEPNAEVNQVTTETMAETEEAPKKKRVRKPTAVKLKKDAEMATPIEQERPIETPAEENYNTTCKQSPSIHALTKAATLFGKPTHNLNILYIGILPRPIGIAPMLKTI